MVELTHAKIEPEALLREVDSRRAGAVVLFLGVARQFTGDQRTQSLDYECYPAMAERKLNELEAQARRRWSITGCAMAHRLGRVELGEASVAIAVSAPHRQEAFAAGQWLIDMIKEVVPIWKKENWADGTSQWVHPGLVPQSPAPPRAADQDDV
jgi:molybdopterin synthase catalytic subunit